MQLRQDVAVTEHRAVDFLEVIDHVLHDEACAVFLSSSPKSMKLRRKSFVLRACSAKKYKCKRYRVVANGKQIHRTE